MKEIIQLIRQNIRINKYLIKATIVMIALWTCMVQNTKAQQFTDASWGDLSVPEADLTFCAPYTYRFNLKILTENQFAASDLRVGVTWGTGTFFETSAAAMTAVDNGNGTTTYSYPTTITNTYVPDDDCVYNVKVYVRYKNNPVPFESPTTHNVTVWNPDNEGMGELIFVTETDKGNVNDYLVCAGKPVDVAFNDLSNLACLTVIPDPAGASYNLEVYKYNVRVRNTQYVYGIANGTYNFDDPALNVPNPPMIPEVTVGNTKVTGTGAGGNGTLLYPPDGYEQGVKTFNKTAGETMNDLTPRITIPEGVTKAGQIFTLELRNWNYCNSYPNNPAVTETARIIVVPAPPDPEIDTVEFCHENHYSALPDYTVTITHNVETGGFTPGVYRWYADNNGVPGKLLAEKRWPNKKFNPFSTADIKPADNAYRIPRDGNNRPVPGRYTYYVEYQYDDRTGMPPGDNCETKRIPITWIIRNDISVKPAVPAGNKFGCAGATLMLNYPSLPATEQFGGQTRYFWEVVEGTAVLTENTTNRGQSATLQLTGNPGAPNTMAVKIRVHREWVKTLNSPAAKPGTCRYVYPASETGGCNFCPGDFVEFTVTINPLPTATLSGGGEICAGEKLSLNLSNLRGKIEGGKYRLEVTLSNGEVKTYEYTGNPGSTTIEANPADGTITDYSIAKVRDVNTGCISLPGGGKVTGSAKVIKRGALPKPNLIAPLPPAYLCPNTGYPWEASPLPTPVPATSPALAVTYRWTWAGGNPITATTNPRTINSGAGAFPNGTSKELTVAYRYTNPALQSKLTDRYCPSEATKTTRVVVPLPTVTLSPGTQTVCNDVTDVAVDMALRGLRNSAWTVNWNVTEGAIVKTTGTVTVPGNSSGIATDVVTILLSTIDPNATSRPGTYKFNILSVTQAANTGCAATSKPSSTFVIRETPKANISGSQLTCEKADSKPITIQLAGDAGGTYTITYETNKQPGVQTVPNLTNGNTFTVPASLIKEGATTTIVTLKLVSQTVGGKTCSAPANATYSITTVKETSAGGDKSICGLSIDLTATPAAGGHWVKVNAADPLIFSDVNSPTSTVSIPTTSDYGAYDIKWVVPGGEDCADQITVSFGTAPNKSVINGKPAVCGLKVTLTGTAQKTATEQEMQPWETGEWELVSVPTGGHVVTPTFPTNSPMVDIEVDMPGTYTFKWTVSSACPTPTPKEIAVTFNRIPDTHAPVPVAPSPACQGDDVTVNFTDNNGLTDVTYEWDFNGSGTNTAAPPVNQITVKAPSHSYNNTRNFSGSVVGVTYPGGIPTGCRGASVSFEVAVKPKPRLLPVTDKTLCPADSFALSLTPGLTGHNVTYKWEGIDNADNAAPHPNTGMADGNATASVNPYVVYMKADLTADKDPTNTYLVAESGRMRVSAMVQGCPSDTVKFNVTVNPRPTVDLSVSETAYCSVETVDVTNAVSFASADVPSAAFTWKYEGNNIGNLTANSFRAGRPVSGTTPPAYITDDFITADNAGTGDLTGKVVVSAAAAGCSAADTFIIAVRPRPRLDPLSIPNQSVCPLPTGNAKLDDIVPTPAESNYGPYSVSYAFASNPTLNTVFPAASINAATITNIVNPGNVDGSNKTATVTVTPMLRYGISPNFEYCRGVPEDVTLTVYPQPVINSIASQAVCSRENFEAVTFTTQNLAASAIDRYEWTFDPHPGANVVGKTGSGTGNIPGFPAINNLTGKNAKDTVTVHAFSRMGCRSADSTYTYTVYPSPVINQIAALPPAFCPGTPVTVPAFSSNIPTSPTSPTVTYTWRLSDATVGITSTPPAPDVYLPGVPAAGNMPAFTGAINFTGSNKISTVTVTATSSDKSAAYPAGCPGANTMTFDLTLRPAPKMNPVTIPEYCPDYTVNGGISISSNVAGSNVTWELDNVDVSAAPVPPSTVPAKLSGTGNGGIPEFITANTVVPGIATGTVKATATSLFGCKGDTTTFKIVVKPAPDIAAPVDTFYCAGEHTGTIRFKSSFPGITYNWTRTGDNIGLSNTTGTDVVPSFTSVNNSANMLRAQSSVFTVNSSLNGCKSKDVTFSMTVMPYPQLDTYAQLIACAGLPQTPPAFVAKDPDTDVRYNFGYTFGWASSTIFKEMQLVPLALPATGNQFPSSGSGNLPAFVGDTTKASYATNDLWGTVAKNVTITVTPQVTYTYPATTPYSGTLKTCSGVDGNAYITINPLPVTKIQVPTSNCVKSDDMVVYQIDGKTNGSEYVWEDGIGLPAGKGPVVVSPVAPINDYQLYQYPTDAESWSGYISVKERNHFGCEAPPARLNLNVIGAPIVAPIANVAVCSGDTFRIVGTILNKKPATTYAYEWYGGSGSIIDDIATNAPLFQVYSTIPKVQFSVRDGACQSNIEEFAITVNPKPAAPLIVGAAYCSEDDPWNMSAIVGSDPLGNPYPVLWKRWDGTNTLPIETTPGVPYTGATIDMKDAAYINALPNPITYTGTLNRAEIDYYVRQTNEFGCVSDSASARMTLSKTPDVPDAKTWKYCEKPAGEDMYSMTVAGNNIRWYDPGSLTPNYPVWNGGTYAVQKTDPGTYSYEVTQLVANGCESLRKPIDLVVHALPKIKFDVVDSVTLLPTTAGCSPLTIRAVNNSPLPDSEVQYNWTWNWANSTTPLGPHAPQGDTVNHKYTTLRTIPEANTLKLTAVSKLNFDTVTFKGCTYDSTMVVTIYPGVVANFVSDTAGCAPLIATFNNTSQYASSFRWYWDEPSATTPPANNAPGAGAIAPNVMNQFVNTDPINKRTYNVWLQVDNGRCYDNKSAVVTVYPMPGVDFKHNLPGNSICPPDSVLFTNLSSNNNPALTKYVWNYDDGNIDTVTMTPPGIYHRYVNITGMPVDRNVMLTAVNKYSSRTCSSSKDTWITVNPQVIAAFTPEPAICSSPLARTQFFSQSTGANRFIWHWGDGSAPTTGPMPSHVYTNPRHDQPLPLSIKLVAENYWCKDSVTHPFTVNPQPAVFFKAGPMQGCQPLPVTFTNTSNTYDATGNPTTNMKYEYDFGDASSATENDTDPVSHTYTNLGGVNATVYPKLTATNGWGCTNTYTHTGVTIYPYVRADFKIVGDSAGCAPLKTTFVNGSRGYSTFVWDFDDGYTMSGTSSPSHEFANASYYADSIYYVKLTVTSGNNCTDTMTQKVIVHGQPHADFQPGAPYPADFAYPAPPIDIINTVRAPDKHHLAYMWSVVKQGSLYANNFSYLEDPNPLLIPQTSDGWGKFDITQSVSTNYCSDRITRTVNIVPPTVDARFDAIPPACMPYEVQFNNTSQYAKAYLWSFGDGATSNLEHPQHTYADPGTYTVRLTVTGDSDYPSWMEHQVVVHPKPQAAFEVQPTFLWVGQPARAFNYTSHESSAGQNYDVWYRWDWGDNTPIDTIENPSHMYLKAGDFDVTLTVGTNTEPQCTTSLTLPNVIEMKSAGDLVLPNTFKPSMDGERGDRINPSGYQNFLFYPPVLSPTRKYHFAIYTRWGQLLFETNDPEVGWNGYFRGRLCDEGVYIYKIEGVFETGQSFSKMGDVLLLR